MMSIERRIQALTPVVVTKDNLKSRQKQKYALWKTITSINIHIYYISINYFNPLIIWEISMECADEAEDFSDITGSQNARVFVS